MHTFLAFFAWPDGTAWSNVIAMPVCALIAAAAAYLGRDRLGGALRPWLRRHFGHHDELGQIKATLDAHADLLDTGTPGGMAAVIAELRETRMAAESALAGIQALSSIAKPSPRRGATPMQKKAPTGKAET